ncbi:MAG: hypothetical protein QOE73_1633, partial [Verrucomicrobiota bacterium]
MPCQGRAGDSKKLGRLSLVTLALLVHEPDMTRDRGGESEI